MTDFSGRLRKMQVQLSEQGGAQVRYDMVLDSHRINLNLHLGKTLRLVHSGEINCIHCDRKIKKSFNQGYCYPCFKSLAQCDLCIMSPERCHYDAGTCREPEWGEEFCMQDHYVYLANSSGLKVGITRGTQIPTRWIDQGAIQAIPVYRVKTRHYAGLVEVVFKQHVADKTNWRAMLKGSPELLDLTTKAEELKAQVAVEVTAFNDQYGLQSVQECNDVIPTTIEYPVLEYPVKVTSQNFDKTPEITGTLMGIKGQYLILDSGVLNLRKFAGYHITLSI